MQTRTFNGHQGLRLAANVVGAGHMGAGDDNDQFNAAVEALLKRMVQV